MKLIVGLGNPGEKYQKTRHNIGFMVIERLASKLDVGGWQLQNKFNSEIIRTPEYILAKPQTFMNDSGVAVSAITHFYKIAEEDVFVIHDDLDIVLGKAKLVFGSGPKVHNGLGSVREKLGTNQFWYARIGVENRSVKGNGGIPGVEYSLQNFSPVEVETIQPVIVKICEELASKIGVITKK